MPIQFRHQQATRADLHGGHGVTIMQHHRGTGGQRVTSVNQAVFTAPLQRDEGIAGRDPAAVQRQPGHAHGGHAGRRRNSLQQLRQRHHHGCTARAISVPMLSGGTFRRRIESAITRPNSGAATWPP